MGQIGTIIELIFQIGGFFRCFEATLYQKLSREGIYVPMERKTKSGEPIVRKSELVAQIEEYFSIEVPSLVKATKADLQKLVGTIQHSE